MQLTFGDAEYNGKRKRTRRKVFLAEMDQVVPWKDLLTLIDPHYPKSLDSRGDSRIGWRRCCASTFCSISMR